MQWHAQSSDLNPSENIRKQLDDKVHLHGRFRNAESNFEVLNRKSKVLVKRFKSELILTE